MALSNLNFYGGNHFQAMNKILAFVKHNFFESSKSSRTTNPELREWRRIEHVDQRSPNYHRNNDSLYRILA